VAGHRPTGGKKSHRRAIVDGVAAGQLTVPEGAAISAMIGNFARVVESLKHEERIQALEKHMKAQQNGQYRK
jgi:hypothetical protein